MRLFNLFEDNNSIIYNGYLINIYQKNNFWYFELIGKKGTVLTGKSKYKSNTRDEALIKAKEQIDKMFKAFNDMNSKRKSYVNIRFNKKLIDILGGVIDNQNLFFKLETNILHFNRSDKKPDFSFKKIVAIQNGNAFQYGSLIKVEDLEVINISSGRYFVTSKIHSPYTESYNFEKYLPEKKLMDVPGFRIGYF